MATTDERSTVERLESLAAELRRQLDQVREELREATGDPTGETTASLTGNPIIAGQSNQADAPTSLSTTTPTIALVLSNTVGKTTQYGPSSTALYAYSPDIGAIITVAGDPPYPLRSRAIQAYCLHGDAILAQSVEGTAVYAQTDQGDTGLLAENGSGNARGHAVVALGGGGIGVYASGSTAALQLGSSGGTGAPTGGYHEAGELVLDSGHDLYLCKVSGTPGTWKQLG